MLPSDVAETVIATATSVALVGLPVVVLGFLFARLTHRRSGWAVGVAVAFSGMIIGYALLASETLPLLRAAAILGIIVSLVLTAVSDRLTDGGFLLVGASFPWTAYAGSVFLDAVVAGRRIDPAAVAPPLICGLVGIAVGIALIRFHRQYLARHPAAASPDVPAPARAWNAASQAALGPTIAGLNIALIGLVAALIVGTQVTVVVGHGRGILEALAVVVIGSIATGLTAVLVWVAAWPPEVRRAFEAFAWLGEWELERFRDLTGGALTPSVANMKRHVRNTPERPEDRWIRVEILAATGKLAEARAIAERIPDDTPIGRAERANELDYIDWLQGGPGDQAAFREAVEAIEPADGDDRLRAEVTLAMSDVRRLVAAGDPDPAAPLRDVRARIGARADRIWLPAGRRMLPGTLRLAGVFIVIVTLIDRATTA